MVCFIIQVSVRKIFLLFSFIFVIQCFFLHRLSKLSFFFFNERDICPYFTLFNVFHLFRRYCLAHCVDSSGFFSSNDSDIYQYSASPSTFYGASTFGAEQVTTTGANNFRKRHGNSSLPLYGFSTHRYQSDWD